jgi:hypothetical protein
LVSIIFSLFYRGFFILARSRPQFVLHSLPSLLPVGWYVLFCFLPPQDELGTRPSKNKETAIKQRKNDTNQEGKGQ